MSERNEAQGQEQDAPETLEEDDARLLAPLLVEIDPEDWEDASVYERPDSRIGVAIDGATSQRSLDSD